MGGDRAVLPAGEARSEITRDRSRFIACAGPAFSVEDARAFIARIKAEFPDASHHVPAFIIGRGASCIAHCTDDGEPSGTAGRPALAVLQGSGLGDVVLVVVRYFGGIKLGTGGLVKAYTEAAQSVLGILPRAERVPTAVVMLAFPYSFVERMRQYVARYQGEILEEDFGADVILSARFREAYIRQFAEDVRNLTRGTVETIIIERNPNTIMPLSGPEGEQEVPG